MVGTNLIITTLTTLYLFVDWSVRGKITSQSRDITRFPCLLLPPRTTHSPTDTHIMFRGRAYNDWLDPYGVSRDLYGFGDDGIGRSSFAPVSNRAYKALDEAKTLFRRHLSSVDTSAGPVTEEIIKFHLVPDMKKQFNKYVKEYGCTASQRKLTREEQDKINKTRKSLMIFTSVTVSPQAQQAYLAKNPATAPVVGSSKTAAAADSSKTAAAPPVSPPAPLGTSQSLKRTANDAHLDETGVAAPQDGGSLGKKKKL
ncbi:hypothetical protein C8R47DRAFT_807310 [Mycena vitilis]|nr:hypothetical protein C8R47DRAFT_807310 [Mycena vitilis]